MEIVLSDPTYRPREGGAGSLGERVALRFIHDRRDLPFLKLMAIQSATVISSGVVLFLPGAFRWWLAGAHLAMVVYFLGPFVLMLHNTSHRRLFRRPWGWMNQYIPWVLGPFFGESPETYFAHHVGMHHPENNLEDDLSSTMPYVRDSFVGFMRYFFRFFFFAILEISHYFVKKRRHALMIRCIGGELLFCGGALGLLLVNWRAALVVFVAPYVIVRFAMMAGNWGQHAFVDQSAPGNCYRNSITCINSGYNRRCFNDGYHIGHHIKSTRHWTEMPEDFLRNLGTYDREGAIVFAGIDFFGVWLCLMLKRYDWLATRVVQLGEMRSSTQDVVALLRSRTGWTRKA
jgi:fatty acid desaturase